ncbi:MAG: hypothetical protein KatS3mg132_931 [Limisphaera sp.]|nr:MAG: hypothetical protein KatS3mg132_931 [Limisphaera sp.]
MCLKGLSRNWQARWGHPVLLVESFVDESRYRGECHRACGFKAVGQRIAQILRRVQGTVDLEMGGCGGRGRWSALWGWLVADRGVNRPDGRLWLGLRRRDMRFSGTPGPGRGF